METTTTPTRGKGFAALTSEERSRIASMGGKSAKNRHRFTSEEAQAAGRKGGKRSGESRGKLRFREEL